MSELKTPLKLWQFQIDGRPAGPKRESKLSAFADAVNDGYAVWTGSDAIKLDPQAAIARVSHE